MKIAYYVSGHGFGHISRSEVIIRELSKKVEKIYLITKRENFLTDNFSNAEIIKKNFDPEIAQKTSIDLDITKTKENIRVFENKKTQLIDEEKKFLQENKIDLIVSDSASLPFKISKEMNIPSVFIGNFTWDFIFQNYSSKDSFFQEYSVSISNEYSHCDLGLILPFHCPIHSIRNFKKVGLIGRVPTCSKQEARKKYNFSKDMTYFLFSFGAYGVSEKNFRFDLLPKNYKIVVSGYEGFSSKQILSIKNTHYPDLISASDYVVTKPGYGILAETYFANTPIIYTDRGDFAEYPYLVNAMKKYHKSYYLSNEDLYNFNFQNKISPDSDTILTQKPEKLENGLSEIVSEIKKIGSKKNQDFSG